MSASHSNWELRWHPLRREWVIVAAHRGSRPWAGGTVSRPSAAVPKYVADCQLCPGNLRVSGIRNDDYAGVFVFDNDHPCVGPDAPEQVPKTVGIYNSAPARGVARVVCYTRAHDKTLAELGAPAIADLLGVLQAQQRELGSRPEVKHVLMFENKGEVVGVSNPHPHCQIYAVPFVFKTMETMLDAEREHLRESGRPLFLDIIASEQQDGRRLVAETDEAIAFLPYFARFAYEAYVAPKRPHADLTTLTDAEVDGLSRVLEQLLVRYDNLWQTSLPYVMVLHQAPTDGADYSHHHFHIQFCPPLRAPGLLKYLAGPELGGGGFVTDTAPEDTAAELRALPAVPWRAQNR